jgi:N utilization substance protein B
MKLTRTEAREKIMIILYQIDLYKKEHMEYNVEDVIKENLEIDNKYVHDIVNGVLENQEKIDKIINKYLEKWTLNRLGKTDASILRLATYEMLYYDTPALVVLNEAIELAKKYSDDKVVALVNAVLDKIRDNEEINGE